MKTVLIANSKAVPEKLGFLTLYKIYHVDITGTDCDGNPIKERYESHRIYTFFGKIWLILFGKNFKHIRRIVVE